LGITLNELVRLDEAEASYIQAIALKPDFALAHGNLGKVLMEKGRHKEALASLRRGNGAIVFNIENGVTIQ
jgi:Flp pilus assembly protein TadD